MADTTHDRELKNALAAIEKQFGKGAIMQLGENALTDIAGISTGALSLDIALGGRGIPRGRIIEIDPIYVDRMIMRWQEFAKDDAVLAATGRTFAQVVKDRARSKKSAA